MIIFALCLIFVAMLIIALVVADDDVIISSDGRFLVALISAGVICYIWFMSVKYFVPVISDSVSRLAVFM